MNPKAGKTTLAYELFKQEGLFLGFEDGTRALSGAMAIPIHSWETLTKNQKEGEKKTPAVNKQLKMDAVKEKFKVIIIDTADLMYERAIEQICKTEGVKDVGEIGFGQGYRFADKLFKSQLIDWEAEGYRLFFISHAEDKKLSVKDYQGQVTEVSQFVPSLDKRAFKIISKMVDNVFFIYTKTNDQGQEERVVFTRETPTFFAGTRFAHLPNVLPLDATTINEEILKAIEKEELTTDEKYVTPNFANVEYEEFKEVKTKVIRLVQEFFVPNKQMDIVQDLIVKQLGEGRKINDTTAEDIDALDVIYDILIKRMEELQTPDDGVNEAEAKLEEDITEEEE